MPDQQFGELNGYPEGSVFSNRMEIKNVGIHKYHINGISRVLGIGCDALVLNGGYVDDEIGSIVTGKTKSTGDYVFQGMRIACIGTMGGGLLLGAMGGYEYQSMGDSMALGVLIGVVYSIFTVPAGALIGFIRAQFAEGNTVEYVIGDGEWVIVK